MITESLTLQAPWSESYLVAYFFFFLSALVCKYFYQVFIFSHVDPNFKKQFKRSDTLNLTMISGLTLFSSSTFLMSPYFLGFELALLLLMLLPGCPVWPQDTCILSPSVHIKGLQRLKTPYVDGTTASKGRKQPKTHHVGKII